MGKRFRPRNVKDVVEEIRFLKEHFSLDELEIIDDIFNFNTDRAKKIMEEIIAEDLNLKISFPSGIKYEMLDDEMLQLFRKAGVYRLAFGIESANPQIQDKIGKRVDIPRVTSLIEKATQMGFFTSGFFQLGIPGETKSQMLETIRFALGSKLHTAMFHFTIPFPGTQMYEENVKIRGITQDRFKSAREISINLSAVSDLDLIRLKKYAFLKFYFNPARMLRIFRTFPDKQRLFRNFLNVVSEVIFNKWIIPT